MELWTVPKIWPDAECWIIGGGPSMPRQFGVPEDVIRDVMAGRLPPSAYSSYMTAVHGKHVIGVNNSYLLGDWIDVEFFGDYNWYLVHRERLASFQNLKVSCAARIGEQRYEGVKYLQKDRDHWSGISNNPTRVSWNNNSGSAAISLAHHFGARRILLLGFDMTLDTDNVSHWHGSHRELETKMSPAKAKPKRKLSSYNRHLMSFPNIAKDAKLYGIEILNVSGESVIEQFPKVKLREVL